MREQEQDHGDEGWEQEQPNSEPDAVPEEVQQLWAQCLGELQLQMTRATFDTCLRGSRVIAADEDCLTILVPHPHAVDWLQNRLLPVIQRVLERHAAGETRIAFVAGV
jgi:chromosomal replication initiator protein